MWDIFHSYYKKVQNYLFRPEFELYDLDKDPDEMNNLATDNEFSDILNSLKDKLKTFQQKTRDPWQIMWSHDSSMQGTGVNL